MALAIITLCLVILCSLAVVLPAVGVVGPNSIFGLRTAQTMRSPAAWKAGHIVGTGTYLPFGLASAGLAVVSFATHFLSFAWVGLAVCFVGILIAAVVAHKSASRH